MTVAATCRLPRPASVRGMIQWRTVQQVEADLVALRASAERAGCALACLFSSSDEFEGGGDQGAARCRHVPARAQAPSAARRRADAHPRRRFPDALMRTRRALLRWRHRL